MHVNQILSRKTILGTALTAGLLISQVPAYAQVKIGNNPTAINANAVLDVESTNKGILFPRVALTGTTNAAPLAAHVAGMQVYNTAAVADVVPGAYYNDGIKWVKIISEQATSTQLFGSGAPSGSCSAATMYTDTLKSSPTLGRQWTCSGGAWISYVAPNSTPFYLFGTNNDAGANKGAWIGRNAGIALAPASRVSQSALGEDGWLQLYRSGATYPNYGGYIDFANNLTNEAFKFRIAMRKDLANGDGALALQVFNDPRLVVAYNGRVGIGTTNPIEMLHVKGSIKAIADGATGDLNSGLSTKNGHYLWYDPTGDAASFALQTNDNQANVQLSKKSATDGSVFMFFSAGGVGLGSVTRNAAGIAFNTVSDFRLKENIKSTRFTIQDLMKINVSDYNFKADKSKTVTTGFIAQDLHKIYPDAVTVGGDDVKEKPWTVDYGKVTPLLVKAIQDQQAQIETLQNENRDLKAQTSSILEGAKEMASLRSELEIIKAMIITNSSAKEASLKR